MSAVTEACRVLNTEKRADLGESYEGVWRVAGGGQ